MNRFPLFTRNSVSLANHTTGPYPATEVPYSMV